jgi:hypothetical protein
MAILERYGIVMAPLPEAEPSNPEGDEEPETDEEE